MTPSPPHQQEQEHQQQQQQQQQQQHIHPFPDLCITQNSRLKSCEACRLSNRKCSRDPVCTRCAKKGSTCVYSRNSTRNKAFRALKKSREWTAGRSTSVEAGRHAGANAGALASTPQPKAMESPGSVMSTTPTTAAAETTTATTRTRSSRRQGRSVAKEEQQIDLLPLTQPKEKSTVHPVAASPSVRAGVRALAGISAGVSVASSSTCTITTQEESCNDFLLRLLSPVEMAEISHGVPSPVLIPPRVNVDTSGGGVPLMGVTAMRPPMESSSFFFNEPNPNYVARNAFHAASAVMPGRRQNEMRSFSGGMIGTHGTVGLSADVLAGTSGLLQLYDGTHAGGLDPQQMSTESLVRWLSTPIYEQMGVVGSNSVKGANYELQPMPGTRNPGE
ncbi:hypothetical protein HDU78_007773 [Chytriomyces hyalinus]|nr:hypothetical protein HDU78_007773 [Chytriomyces hyalinus]